MAESPARPVRRSRPQTSIIRMSLSALAKTAVSPTVFQKTGRGCSEGRRRHKRATVVARSRKEWGQVTRETSRIIMAANPAPGRCDDPRGRRYHSHSVMATFESALHQGALSKPPASAETSRPAWATTDQGAVRPDTCVLLRVCHDLDEVRSRWPKPRPEPTTPCRPKGDAPNQRKVRQHHQIST